MWRNTHPVLRVVNEPGTEYRERDRSHATPDMLILARESRGMTQMELAAAAGVPIEEVCLYEGGTRFADAEYVARVSVALDYPADFFYLDERRYGVSCPAVRDS